MISLGASSHFVDSVFTFLDFATPVFIPSLLVFAYHSSLSLRVSLFLFLKYLIIDLIHDIDMVRSAKCANANPSSAPPTSAISLVRRASNSILSPRIKITGTLSSLQSPRVDPALLASVYSLCWSVDPIYGIKSAQC